MKTAAEALADFEAARRWFSAARLRGWPIGCGILAFYVVAAQLVHFDLGKLAAGIPKLWHWLLQAWPPKYQELPLFLWRTAETVAMAAIGTTVATLIGIPSAILASRNITPFPRLYYPTRWLLNALRGIDIRVRFVVCRGSRAWAVRGCARHRLSHIGHGSQIVRRSNRNRQSRAI